MSFGEEDGEEFDQVKVALVPVVELDVPDEFGVGGQQRPKDLSPRGRYREESLREDDKVLSPRSYPHV